MWCRTQEHLSSHLLSSLFTAGGFGEPLKCTVVVLHSSHKITIKTHCLQAEENIEERSMWAICEHHAGKERTPPAPQERKRKANIFFLLRGRGKYCNELWRKVGFWGALNSAEEPLCQDHNQMFWERPNRNECVSTISSNLSDLRVHPQYHLIDK